MVSGHHRPDPDPDQISILCQSPTKIIDCVYVKKKQTMNGSREGKWSLSPMETSITQRFSVPLAFWRNVRSFLEDIHVVLCLENLAFPPIIWTTYMVRKYFSIDLELWKYCSPRFNIRDSGILVSSKTAGKLEKFVLFANIYERKCSSVIFRIVFHVR